MAMTGQCGFLNKRPSPFFIAPCGERGVVAGGKGGVISVQIVRSENDARCFPSPREAVGRGGEYRVGDMSRGGGTTLKRPSPLTPPHHALRAWEGGETLLARLKRQPDATGSIRRRRRFASTPAGRARQNAGRACRPRSGRERAACVAARWHIRAPRRADARQRRRA